MWDFLLRLIVLKLDDTVTVTVTLLPVDRLQKLLCYIN